MANRLPADALEAYLAMGASRSYEAVAARYGVAKKTITRRAAKENWQARVAEVESKARERAAQKAVDAIEETNSRHLRAYRALELKALEGLRSIALDNPTALVKALEVGITGQRVILGLSGKGGGDVRSSPVVNIVQITESNRQEIMVAAREKMEQLGLGPYRTSAPIGYETIDMPKPGEK